ncbi:hypothetical protein B0T24DRAFT_683498 [Lasiosphaeria ovina]|uniref:Protein kinase domain-containing protein n=1 Tax=Lasiosphaeria ovina TaxID=92902 RepID=A0AAE0MZ62_9PEZI|nr:hypothetical protein B0T24DRAFT_683498 [Lasiosphaeria ovina]
MAAEAVARAVEAETRAVEAETWAKKAEIEATRGRHRREERVGFARSVNEEPPLYLPSLFSGASTVDGDSRYGLEFALYKRQPGCRHSLGATASTFRVSLEGETEPELVAKEPNYKSQPAISALGAAENLEDEFNALRRIQHPQVVTEYDLAKPFSGTSAMHPPWIILENLPYGLSEAVHLARYIHRDLKPDNVRATKSTPSGNWILKICDLGSATLQTAADKGFAGTPGYIAPDI